MNNKNDIRWLQRLANFQKAMRNLAKAVNLSATRELSDLEKQGLIQGFENCLRIGLEDYQRFL